MMSKQSSTAKVIDGTLIISLHDAINPVVWQMELGQTKASGLEIRSNDNGTTSLVLKTPRQDIEEIASYQDKATAIKALTTVSKALEKAKGQLKGSSSSGGFADSFLGFLGRIAKIAAIIAAILIALFILSGIVGFIISGGKPAQQTASSEQNAPLSADDFLEGR